MATGLGTLTFDFGAAPGTNLVTTTVTGQAAISSATSKVEIFMMGTDSTASHTAYEHAIIPLDAYMSCISITTGTGFVAQMVTTQRLTGTFAARFVWAD
jgi:hypothetical protein